MKDDRVYLEHIIRCISRIEEYTAGGRESFLSSPIVQDATLRVKALYNFGLATLL